MSEFFDRKYRLVCGQLDVSELDIAFKVTKTNKPKPNTCTIKIWNLGPENRALLATPKNLPIRLDAGYRDGIATIFLGEVRTLQSATVGTDIITTLSTGDSEKAVQKAHLNVPIGAGAGPDQAIRLIANAMGVGEGNTQAAIAKIRTKGFANVYGKRAVLSGHASQELTDLCKSAGLEWSIQDGKIQVLDLNKPLEGTAFLVSADTGMIGSPTVDHKGFVECTMFLLPILRIGSKVQFDAENMKGLYRVIHLEFKGSNREQEWQVKMVCQRITAAGPQTRGK